MVCGNLIIILRPSGPDPTAEMTRQFRKRFRVRRRVLEIWLEFLANNHPGYRASGLIGKP